jgi:hypothetical protein
MPRRTGHDLKLAQMLATSSGMLLARHHEPTAEMRVLHRTRVGVASVWIGRCFG